MMIPNEDFIINRVTNWTFNNRKGRLELNIGVAYESDIERAMELILEGKRASPMYERSRSELLFKGIW